MLIKNDYSTFEYMFHSAVLCLVVYECKNTSHVNAWFWKCVAFHMPRKSFRMKTLWTCLYLDLKVYEVFLNLSLLKDFFRPNFGCALNSWIDLVCYVTHKTAMWQLEDLFFSSTSVKMLSNRANRRCSL